MQLLKKLSLGISQELIENGKENEVKENRMNRKKVKVKILTLTNYLVIKVIDELTNIKDNKIATTSSNENNKDISTLQIRYLESSPRYNVTTATILIVDRKALLVIEKVDDDSKTDFIEKVGLSTYSTSKPTIASYVSIFENFWSQIELYEKLRATEKTEKEFINLADHELRTLTYSGQCWICQKLHGMKFECRIQKKWHLNSVFSFT